MEEEITSIETAENNEPEEELEESEVETTEHFPPEGSKRWKSIYRRMKDYERNLQKVTDELNQREEILKELKEHNKRLAEVIEKSMSRQEEEVDEVKEIQAKIDELKERRKAAIKEDDLSSIDNIDEQLIDLKLELRDAKARKAQMMAQKAHMKRMTLTDDEKMIVDKWIKANPWWVEDPIMRGAAREIDMMLANDYEWSHKPLEERLNEVKRRVEARFGLNRKPPAGTEGTGSSFGRNLSKNAKLSDLEIKIANLLGISEKEYAKQKSLIEKYQEGGE